MSPLPPPSGPSQPYCYVSVLEAGFIDLPLHLFLSDSSIAQDQKVTAPSLSFLIQHSTHPNKTFLFDLGIRKNWETYPPGVVKRIRMVYNEGINIPNDVCDSLAKGGLKPEDIKTVCVSHLHWDHIASAEPFKNATFLLGPESKALLDAPPTESSVFANDLPPERIKFVPLDSESEAAVCRIGPFPKAYDLYGDGSLYIVDAPGHVRGHVNVLVRTSSDGGWIYLAGDSGHHWALITGQAEIADTRNAHTHYPGFCAHEDKEKAREHIARIRELIERDEEGRVRVILAHDEQWFRENKGGSAFWPGKIESK
ncbi:hypothetical protein D9758_002647 [Tetrapyrgos nigripes]|uniref:Metallo-beta-lactamase domain-containing protein n=1 Tax=Tetrapyrgos nigripes TaxID=182062 RepID=A0A8H5LTY1_9AGAR|nr:hypothetical protein D9758_002647 [Tetrapyrgos nigripes]